MHQSIKAQICARLRRAILFAIMAHIRRKSVDVHKSQGFGEQLKAVEAMINGTECRVRDRIHLQNNQTLDHRQRTVILSQKLQREISHFVGALTGIKLRSNQLLIKSQKGGHFSPTTMVSLELVPAVKVSKWCPLTPCETRPPTLTHPKRSNPYRNLCHEFYTTGFSNNMQCRNRRYPRM